VIADQMVGYSTSELYIMWNMGKLSRGCLKVFVGLTIVLLGCGMEWCVVSTSELLSVFILVFLELVSVQSHFI
jgi:hypothetical protein